jgi:2-oxo-3-hexenedioate decarboxylase/2-keto-4-pentenoate hydratase
MSTMPPSDRDAAAEWIAAARLAARSLAAMPSALKPRAELDGYRVQAAVRDRLSAAGYGGTIGWKVGATTRAMQQLLNLPGPGAGEMLERSRIAQGARLRAADFTRLGIECEIAVELASPLAGTVDAASAAAAVGRIFPAIEVVDDRYGDFRSFGTAAIIADFVFHHAIILGEPVRDWRAVDLAAVVGVTRANGRVMVEGRGADVLGHPMASLAWLANKLTELGRRLEAGQIVMTGSLPLPYWPKSNERIEIDLGALGSVAVDID